MTELQATARALQRTGAKQARLETRLARMTSHPRDGSHSAAARKARTRHLIELGGLVQKAGLVELTDDDRAAILGALLEAAETVQGMPEGIARDNRIARWRRRGRREFEEDQAGRE